MELKTFISSTLVQIMQGVRDAQHQTQECGGMINVCSYTHEGRNPIQTVEFDVAVTTSAGTETAGGLGIIVGAINVGTRGKSDSNNQSISRIKFSVPVMLPVPDIAQKPSRPHASTIG